MARHLLTWIDETPRDVMQRNLAAAIDGVLDRRRNLDQINAELAEMTENMELHI